MSVYRTITVNAELHPNRIRAETDVNGNIDAEASMAVEIVPTEARDYNILINKPQINSVELMGNKSLPEIGVDTISNMDIEHLLT